MDVVLPVPAGPRRTSTTRPEVTILIAAGAWSSADRVKPRPGSLVPAIGTARSRWTTGAVRSPARVSNLSSAARTLAEVNTIGRANSLTPSTSRNAAGTVAVSPSVSATESCSAAATTRC